MTIALETTHGSFTPTKDAATILKILKRTPVELAKKMFEPEYTEIDGLLHINRLVKTEKPNAHVFLKTTQPVCTREFEKLPPLKLNVKIPGLLDTLEFVENASFKEAIPPDEIEVDVQAIRVNFKKCLVCFRTCEYRYNRKRMCRHRPLRWGRMFAIATRRPSRPC